MRGDLWSAFSLEARSFYRFGFSFHREDTVCELIMKESLPFKAVRFDIYPAPYAEKKSREIRECSSGL